MSVTIGSQLGSHLIPFLLGRGGMGGVYRARDTKLKKQRSKSFVKEFSRDPERVVRFQREAEALASDKGGGTLIRWLGPAMDVTSLGRQRPERLVWPKMAKGNDDPLRILEEDHTLLAEAQGIALDTKNQFLYVSNQGSYSSNANNVGWSRALKPGFTTWDIPDRIPASGF